MLAIAIAPPACAQVQAGVQTAVSDLASQETSRASKLTFDAVSVRPSSQEFFLKGVDFLDPVGEVAPPKGGLFSWNIQLSWLMSFAYDLRSSQVRRGAWEALPKWAQDNWYTVEARAEGNPTRNDVQQMVRSLLEDRFQLAAHLEEREGQVYALVVDKPGLGLKLHPEGAPCGLSSLKVDKYPHTYPSYDAHPAHCGAYDRELSRSGERRFEMLDLTPQQIADSLSRYLPLSVVDQTRLLGRYDAVLDFAAGAMPPTADSTTDEIGLPRLPAAIEKQLGLKLVKQKARVDVFVIDHIGTLTEN